jgi:energy-coupling factor transporter ATP-binding protein EcfA2
MKISKLHIDHFRHLKNLVFDFTYPEDFHDENKRGKPLKKICFIGQSATGKTSLLELIDIKTFNNSYLEFPSEFKSQASLDKLNASLNLYFKDNDNEFEIGNNEILINYNLEENNITKDSTKKIYFPSELNVHNIIQFLNPENINIEKNDLSLSRYNQFKLSDNNFEEIYSYLLIDLINYREKLINKATILLGSKTTESNKVLNELDKWKLENPNPNDGFAKEFNTILEKLNLEIDTLNTSLFLSIKPINSSLSVPIYSLSTGTKLLISLLFPIYKFDTKDSIILIDEPERSLYPDMQMELMEYYQNLAPEAQFIVATHSPFIAASFEPEERFILYFDEEGKVAVRRGSSPIGDDPNDMLYNDFGVYYINKIGQEKYNEYLDLKQKIYFEKNEKTKKMYAEKLEKLGDEYNF